MYGKLNPSDPKYTDKLKKRRWIQDFELWEVSVVDVVCIH